MKEGYYFESRSKFIKANEPALCVGNAEECRRLDAGTHVDWGTLPSAADLRRITTVHLLPATAEALRAELPAFLGTLPELRRLTVPQPFISVLRQASLPGKLACLQVSYDDKITPRGEWEAMRWSGEVLPGVLGFYQRTDSSPSSAWRVLGLSSKHLPALKFLNCELDGNEAALNAAAEFTTVEHMALEIVKDLPVLERLPASLDVLMITMPTKNFSFAKLQRLRDLRVLRINSARCEIDCATFVAAPQLVELDVLNSKKLKNVEALLECPNLKSLGFLDCGKPFKAPLKARFKAHGFERLEIDYA